jgi:adenylate kinase
MRLVLLGAPGSGKGTQAAMLKTSLGVPHISTGDMFRFHIKDQTELGKKVKEYTTKGLLVPDEVTIAMVKDRLSKPTIVLGGVTEHEPAKGSGRSTPGVNLGAAVAAASPGAVICVAEGIYAEELTPAE